MKEKHWSSSDGPQQLADLFQQIASDSKVGFIVKESQIKASNL